MKLDFSALAQPAAKTRGQVGTTGTPAFTRVCASPPAQPGAGTTGDKPAALMLASDLVVAVAAACPPLSPACPQAANAEKLSAGAVSPASPLVPVETAQVVAAAQGGCEDLGGKPPHANGDGFQNGGFHEGFHRKDRPTHANSKVPAVAPKRTLWLTNDDSDRCHAPCWDDAEIAAFTARTERFAVLGQADADDLAERLTLRDRDGDDRRLCLECTWLGDTGRCLAAATGRIPGADRRLEPVQTILQRCGAFGLRKGLV